MKTRFIAGLAAALCCLSCIESNLTLGGNLIPLGQTYDFYTVDIPLEDINITMTDSLSGFSSSRITVGAVKDNEYGLSTRACALTLIPLFSEPIDFGKDPKFINFDFAVAKDTVSFASPDQERILQNIKVYELTKAIEGNKDYDCNTPYDHIGKSIVYGSPVYNGGDSLRFSFTEEFAKKFFALEEEDFSDIKKYTEKIPGIYIETEVPEGEGGRINMFNVQLDYDIDYQYIKGNYASLRFNSEYDGERIDTTVMFYYGAQEFHDLDSLFTSTTTGNFPQYALNLTGHETRKDSGKAQEYIPLEGGGGLKPMISASYLKKIAEDAILAKGGNPKETVVNKASIILPFEFPDDYLDMDVWPEILSPTSRIVSEEGTTSYMGLSDSSTSSEDQGDINRSLLTYAPDVTYHMQELVRLDLSNQNSTKVKSFHKGAFDVWFLIMANELTVTVNSGNSEMSEFYNYLAYQSYYNDMYGGYGGYGGGYGGYGSYYSNYYSYAMMAAYAGNSTTTESIDVKLDKDRYYKGRLNGPEHKSGRVPTLQLTFAIPKEN